MPSRALIIAIENYPANPDLASSLPETHKNARAFIAWLKDSRGFAQMKPADEPSRIVICADDPAFPGRTHDATARGIRQAAWDLTTQAKDGTGELFVYYSGHGFLFKDNNTSRPADVVVPGDFQTMAVDGSLCFPLDLLQTELLSSLGPGNHYYFVDACRNLIDDEQIGVGSFVRLKRSSQANAQVFTLFSTTRLSTAPAASPFTDLLVAGLSGRGKAKQPAGGVPPMMRVVWSSLLEYMKRALPATDGRGEGTNPTVLWEGPVELKTCTITVDNASAADQFVVKPSDILGRPQLTFQFSGPSFLWKQPPDDYRLEVTSAAGPVRAIEPTPPKPVDLYEDAPARFILDGAGGAGFDEILESAEGWSGAVAAREAPVQTQLTVMAPAGSRLRMVNPVSGEVWENVATLSSAVRPGASYQIEAYDRDNTLVVQRDVSVSAGEQHTVDLRFPDTPLRAAITRYFPSSPGTGVDFSESLGNAVTDNDLGLWLSIIGASRVLGSERFEKLKELPLETFRVMPPGFASIYVLSGFDQPVPGLRVRIESFASKWSAPDTVDGLPGLGELMALGLPGPAHISISIPDTPVMTVATYGLANRATVITVTGEPGRLRIHQQMLPIRSLESELDPTVRALLPSSPLRAVKFLVQSQRLLERRRSVSASTGQISEWSDALYAKWLDPLAGVLACYEMLRLGRGADITMALDNLARYFGDLPDTQALLRMAGRPDHASSESSPLVLDGYTAYPEQTFRALPESRLEYGTLWTTWRNAVARPGSDDDRR